MRAYVIDGSPEDIDTLIGELRAIEGVVIHKINETSFRDPIIGRKIVISIQVIFFAMDEEVASYLILKYPNVLRPSSS